MKAKLAYVDQTIEICRHHYNNPPADCPPLGPIEDSRRRRCNSSCVGFNNKLTKSKALLWARALESGDYVQRRWRWDGDTKHNKPCVGAVDVLRMALPDTDPYAVYNSVAVTHEVTAMDSRRVTFAEIAQWIRETCAYWER